MEEKRQVKSDLDRKAADLDGEVSLLKSLLMESKSEKQIVEVAFEATIKDQQEKIIDLGMITDKIPTDLLQLPAQLNTTDIKLIWE